MAYIVKILTVVFLLSGVSAEFNESCTKVLVISGFLAFRIQLQPFVDMINEKRPCSKAELFILDEGLTTFRSIWDQLEAMRPRFLKYMEDNPQGITIVGDSQGAIIGRGFIETTSNHNVHTLFSFSGPHQGLFAIPIFSYYLPVLKFLPFLRLLSSIFYTPFLQAALSLANGWKDPTQYDSYLKNNKVLPYMNNEIPHNRSEMFKINLLKLKKFVCIGGDKDQSVYPWQSNLWGYFDVHGEYPKIVNLTEQETYKNDSLGLKTMNEDGRLLLCFAPDADHVSVLSDPWVLDNCFFPFLV